MQIIKDNAFNIQYINHPTEKVQLEAIKQSSESFQFIKHPTEKVQLKAVKQNSLLIGMISNPSEAVQLESIKNGCYISNIINPTEKVQFISVKKNFFNLFDIIDPSLKTIETAFINYYKDKFWFLYQFFYLKDKSKLIKKCYFLMLISGNSTHLLTKEEKESKLYKKMLRHNKIKIPKKESYEYYLKLREKVRKGELIEDFSIKNLILSFSNDINEDLEKIIFNKSNFYLKYFIHPSDSILIKFFNFENEKNSLFYSVNLTEEYLGRNFKKNFLKYASEEVKLAFAKNSTYALKYIENPSEEVQMEAVRQDGENIRYIENPSEKVQMESVKFSPQTIKYIENPSESVQIEAVKENSYSIQYINHPSESVQMEAVRHDLNSIQLICNPSKKIIEETFKILIPKIDGKKDLFNFFRFFKLKDKNETIRKAYYKTLVKEDSTDLLTKKEKESNLFKKNIARIFTLS